MEIKYNIERWYLELAEQEYNGERITLASIMVEAGLV
jgi:hypothetical protein